MALSKRSTFDAMRALTRDEIQNCYEEADKMASYTTAMQQAQLQAQQAQLQNMYNQVNTLKNYSGMTAYQSPNQAGLGIWPQTGLQGQQPYPQTPPIVPYVTPGGYKCHVHGELQVDEVAVVSQTKLGETTKIYCGHCLGMATKLINLTPLVGEPLETEKPKTGSESLIDAILKRDTEKVDA